MVTFGDTFAVAEFSSVEVFSVEDGHLVVELDIMAVHELLRQDVLARMEVEREHTFVVRFDLSERNIL